MKRPYLALLGFGVALVIVHAVVGLWTPIQGDDWNHWIWNGRHRTESGGAWSSAFFSTHFTFADIASYVLARCRLLHAIVTPVMVLALVVGLFVLAMRRMPRATWDDVLGIVLASALLWMAQPAAGITLFHTPNVGLFVYGCAIAVWFIAPFRCNWDVPRWLWPVLVLGGYAVGTSTRVIATASLFGVVVALRKQRARWMWWAFGGLLVGTIVGYVNPPWIEFGRVFRRGFEQNLVGPGLLKFILEEGGEVISLVAAFALVDIVLGMLGRARAGVDDRPDPLDSLRWLGAWFAATIWCLFGPRYNEATLLPATCMLVIVALPYLLWLASSRVLRLPIIALGVGVHLIVWPIALKTYHRLGDEGAARLAAFEQTKPGEVASIQSYSRLTADFWFLGEDLGIARVRQSLAIEAFGLRDIEFQNAFRRLDSNPGIELALEVDGATDVELRRANVPEMWATELTAARKQFELFIKRLRIVTGKSVSARLAIKNVQFAQAGTRSLLAAWSDSKGVMLPRTLRSSIDPNAQITSRIYRPDSQRFHESWIVKDGVATQVPYHGGSVVFRPLHAGLYVVVGCNPERCLAIDAFIPRF